MTLLDSCLSIITPGYHAPDADRPVWEPRIRPAHRLCACGADEVREGRTQCKACIGTTTGGYSERVRHNAEEKRRSALRRARARAERDLATLAVQHACTCGRPARAGATCGRRVCR
jgi:hypothetical protein